jgi:hypothetical protein
MLMHQPTGGELVKGPFILSFCLYPPSLLTACYFRAQLSRGEETCSQD